MTAYKLLPMNEQGIFKDKIQSVQKIRDDEVMEVCLVTATEFKAWLTEGNTPLPADKEVA